MSKRSSLYKRQRFPPTIIQHVVWLYHRFNLSNRDIEELMAERDNGISYESTRLWCIKFGPRYARRLRRRHQGYGDSFFIDEVFVKIQGRQHYLWRAVDQDGDVVDVFLQCRRDGKAAKRFFKRLLRMSGSEPRRIFTDKLRSYGVAHPQKIWWASHNMAMSTLALLSRIVTASNSNNDYQCWPNMHCTIPLLLYPPRIQAQRLRCAFDLLPDRGENVEIIRFLKNQDPEMQL